MKLITGRISRFFRYSFYVVAVTAFTAYFALTILFVLPPNPLKTLTSVDRDIIGKFFHQDWGLFSPDPIQMDISVHFQCLGSETSTPMLDATTGLWEGRKRNPFAHYDRVGRVVTNNAHSFLMPARHELPLLNFCQEHSDHQICTILEHQLELRREAVVMGLTRLASTFCADMRGRFGTSFDEARIWIATADVPRWSQRYDGIKKPAFTDVATVELVDLPAHGVWR